MPNVKRVGHLVINVKDLDTSTKFYTDIIGFGIAVQRPGFGTFLTCGKIHHDLALFQAKENAQPVADGGLGLNHMALQVEDFEMLTSFHGHLKANNVAIDHMTDHSMTRSIYLKDPDGNGIELFCNSQTKAEDGLAEMRRTGRKNEELVFA